MMKRFFLVVFSLACACSFAQVRPSGTIVSAQKPQFQKNAYVADTFGIGKVLLINKLLPQTASRDSVVFGCGVDVQGVALFTSIGDTSHEQKAFLDTLVLNGDTITMLDTTQYIRKYTAQTKVGVLTLTDTLKSNKATYTPYVFGGNLSTSDLTIKATSGVGASGSDIIFQNGAGGSALRINNGGDLRSYYNIEADGQATYNNTFTGHSAVCAGTDNTVSQQSIVAGESNTLTAIRACAFGASNSVSATFSGAFGWSNTVSGVSSFAFGNSVSISSAYSSGFGYRHTVSGVSSVAFGERSQPSGYASFASGGRRTAATSQLACDSASFIHVLSTERNCYSKGNGSAVLGGRDNSMDSADFSGIFCGDSNTVAANVVNSAIIGGNKITATRSNTVYVPSIDVGDTLSIGGAKILSVTDITDALTTDSLTVTNYMNVQPAIKTMDSATVTDSKTVLVPGGTFTFTASLSGFATLFIDSSGVRLKKMEVSWNSDGVTTIDASYGMGYIATSTSNTASTISFYDGGTSAILKNNLAYTVTAKIKGVQ